METIVKFDYTNEQLNIFAEEANNIDVNDLEAVKEGHKKLVKVRTTITSKGKELRDGAIKYQKAVIEKEKEYLAITSPSEDRLKSIIDAEKDRIIMEARKEMLPQKRDQINLLTFKQDISDDAILAMDDAQWVSYYQEAMSFDQKEKQSIIDAEELEKNREEREAQIRKDEQEKIEKKRIQDEQIARDNEARKIREQEAEKQKLQENEKYQSFLSENNFNESTDRVVEKDGVVRLYRLVAEFKK